ncbi:maleylpyruvate isomerase N-terminal domain-containing protein [Amycolatopsis sp. WAC 01375]|uniref:maleylpyruvate isomerase N-terminal domain-containing protein n=1 Tax=Amycolatopsis sp. WAC 01375 TaxID=2203194 RepID=UPI003512143F
MTTAITADRWQAVRRAYRVTGARFAELVARVPDPDAMVTADWTAADTVAHVAMIAKMYTSLARPDSTPFLDPRGQSQVEKTTVDTVSVLNTLVLRDFPERDIGVLVTGLLADIDEVLRVTEDADPATPLDWLGDSKVPLAGVLAHLVNELHIHGWDIAKALKLPWTMPPGDAALFFDLFMVGVLTHDTGHLLDTDEPPRERRIAVAFRSAYTSPVVLVLHRGRVTVERPGGPVDVRISFDPPTLNLMLFHRVGKARAALTRKIVVSGPRPWLLPAFLRVVRLP